jgi:hypothetical protein
MGYLVQFGQSQVLYYSAVHGYLNDVVIGVGSWEGLS